MKSVKGDVLLFTQPRRDCDQKNVFFVIWHSQKTVRQLKVNWCRSVFNTWVNKVAFGTRHRDIMLSESVAYFKSLIYIGLLKERLVNSESDPVNQ